MKMYPALLLCGMLLIIWSCRQAPDDRTIYDIRYLNTEKGGCNTYWEKSADLNEDYEKPDTLFFQENGDTLLAEIGVNHLCCVLFETNASIVNDTLIFTINDVCSQGDRCYCKCMCYYTFTFRFTDYPCGVVPYKATLFNAFTNTTTVLFTGNTTL
jgi:hypothetical protein